ncbi:MAG: 16S rRNA (cytosine(1402)-N(4))-methyltransferase RsmH [Gemmatimonadales bacterium]
MIPAPSHVPVLLGPIRDAARDARRVVDATLGHGGHAEMFLDLGAEVLGIDRDPEALAIAGARLGARLRTLEAPYASEDALLAVQSFAPDFILLDLGVSSRQLDDDTRGFTFRPGAALDMRMGRAGPSGADLLNEADEETLADIFHYWGDERKARPLGRAIVRRRGNAPFVVSDDFVNAIRSVLGPRSGPGDFARLFQALRIAVNDELEGLERALPAFFDALRPGGRLAVIGYHSGEDRVAKQLFQEWARSCICPPEQPICTCRGRPLGTLIPRKPIIPDAAEVAANPRARSAKLRIFRKAE